MNGRGLKNDGAAFQLWGSAYRDIPKSVFAVVAWYLSDMCSDAGAGHDQANERFIQEVQAMISNGIISERQGKQAIKAIQKG